MQGAYSPYPWSASSLVRPKAVSETSFGNNFCILNWGVYEYCMALTDDQKMDTIFNILLEMPSRN